MEISNPEYIKPSDSNLDPSNSTIITIARLEERNRIARDFITDYANKHAKMDVAIGIGGTVIPGLAIPALIAAIAAQSPLIYQPLARDLAKVYMADPAQLEGASKDVVHSLSILTAGFDIAADFGAEFMMQIANELLTEIGMGVIGSMFIPFIGGAIGAGLDYLIATQMTWRVGTMVSIYYQNGGKWVGSQRHTFDIAEEMTGSMHVGVNDILSGRYKNHTPRVDLNDVRNNVPAVRENLLAYARQVARMLRAATSDDKVREIMKSQGIPVDLIDLVLNSLS